MSERGPVKRLSRMSNCAKSIEVVTGTLEDWTYAERDAQGGYEDCAGEDEFGLWWGSERKPVDCYPFLHEGSILKREDRAQRRKPRWFVSGFILANHFHGIFRGDFEAVECRARGMGLKDFEITKIKTS